MLLFFSCYSLPFQIFTLSARPFNPQNAPKIINCIPMTSISCAIVPPVLSKNDLQYVAITSISVITKTQTPIILVTGYGFFLFAFVAFVVFTTFTVFLGGFFIA